MPAGTGKSGNCGLPSVRDKLQRLAISTLLVIAAGKSANNSCISAWLLKYCSGENFLTRLGLARISPSAIQTRASCAVKSDCFMN